MPKIPGSESLGGPSVPRGTRPIISGADTGAGMVGRGIEKIGATVSAIGEEERQKEDALDLIKADNDLQEGLRATRREFETDPDYKTYGPRFDEKVGPVLDSAASKIRNPNTRAKFLERGKGQIISSRESVLHRGLRLEREHKEVEVENELSRAQGAYATTRDPVERKRILDGMLEKATLAERTGLIRPKKAEDYRDRFVDGTIANDIEERLYEDPEGVLRDLGLVPGGRKPASPTTVTPSGQRVDVPEDGRTAAVRYNNPGAQYPSERAKRFGMTGYGVIGGGHQIAQFPTEVHGGAANMDNFAANYRGMTVGDAVAKWRGGNGTLTPPKGFDPSERIDDAFLGDREKMVKFFDGMSKHEGRGKDGAVSRETWAKAYDMYRAGGMSDYVEREELDPAPDVMPYGDPDAPPSPEDAANPTRTQYAMLSGKRRQVMINKARVALSHKYQQRLANDIARIEDGEDEEVDERGETNFDKARRVLLPNVLAQWQTKKDRATLKRDSLRALKDMPEDQADQHIRSIGRDPRTGEERADIGYATIRAVRVQAEKEFEKIREQRRKDPAAAVSNSPEMRRAVASMQGRPGAVSVGVDEYGDPVIDTQNLTPQQQRAASQQLVESSLAAQERLGISKANQRTISKRQAEKLLDMRNPSELTSQQQKEALTAAAERANRQFGSEMGERVLRDALVLAFHPNADNLRDYTRRGQSVFRDSAAAEERFNLVAKQAFGRSITPQDMGRVQMLDRLDAMPSILPEPGTGMDPGRPYIGQPYQSPIRETRKPNERQTQLLLQQISTNPAQAQKLREDFDAKFGDGAAMRVISKMMGGETDR